MRTPTPPPATAWVLVATNLAPLAGVLFLGWRAADVVFLYWIENVLIGAFNVARILAASPPERREAFAERLVQAAFFGLHYGLFCYGHGEVLAEFFTPSGDLAGVLGEMRASPVMLAAAGALAASHSVSFLFNYLVGGGYLRADPDDLMMRPYRRILVTQVFLLAGALALERFGSPTALVAVFVGVKIGFDMHYHVREHDRIARKPG